MPNKAKTQEMINNSKPGFVDQVISLLGNRQANATVKPMDMPMQTPGTDYMQAPKPGNGGSLGDIIKVVKVLMGGG